MYVDRHVVHIKLNLSKADTYDDLFPPSLFAEPASQSSDVGLVPDDVPCADVPPADKVPESINMADEALEDVEENGSFVGKTRVYVVLEVFVLYY